MYKLIMELVLLYICVCMYACVHGCIWAYVCVHRCIYLRMLYLCAHPCNEYMCLYHVHCVDVYVYLSMYITWFTCVCSMHISVCVCIIWESACMCMPVHVCCVISCTCVLCAHCIYVCIHA